MYALKSWHKPLQLFLEVTGQAVITAATLGKLIRMFQALSFWPPRSIYRVTSCKFMERRKCKCSIFSKYISTSVRRCMVWKVTWLHGREASWAVIWARRVDLTKTNVLDTSNIRLMERLNVYFNILYLKRKGSALWCSITINVFQRIDFKWYRETIGHLALDNMRCSMWKEYKKHLLVSIFTKELAFSSFLVAPDTHLPRS